MNDKESRKERLSCYLTATERDNFRTILKHIGLSESTWLRQQVLREIHQSHEKKAREEVKNII